MRLSVIIVSYNVKFFLEQCLYSVLQATNALEAEVLVIDNNSSDGSIEYLTPLFPSVNFIAQKENVGFGKANNIALSKAQGEYVLFLNPDTIVPEDCFTKCLHFFYKNQKCGAIGVRMLDGRGNFLPESKRSFPNTTTAFYKAVGLSDLFPTSTIFNRYSLGYLNEKQNHSVDVLAGAFMMVRKSVLDKVGAFDEQFFMYGEDIDLSYRIKQSGFENWYLADTSIIHFKGESAKKGSLNHTKMFYAAMIVFVQKHYKKSSSALLRLLLVSAIKAKSFISSIKAIGFRRTGKEQPKTIVIIGTMEECKECLAIFHQHQKENISTIEINSNISVKEIQSHCKTNQIKEIVFCQGFLQYSQIISFIQELGTSFSYRFHAAKSKSIVGSDDKSGVGEVVSSI